MTIKANIMRDVYGNITVQMQGDFDYEYSGILSDQLNKISKQHPDIPVTIDMAGIDFVGSSGICHFVETLRAINQSRTYQVSLSNVRPEFKRIFNLYTHSETELIIQEFDWENDDTRNVGHFGNRKRTFEN